MSRAIADEGALEDPEAEPGWRLAAPSGKDPGDMALRRLWTAWFSLDPRAAVALAVAMAEEEIWGGGGGEDSWYALLRGREMLGQMGPLRVGAANCATLKEAAEFVFGRFDRSPRLAALLARLDGGVVAARAALKVDPTYAPSLLAMARALLREGRGKAARALLERLPELERLQGGAVALARARLATGEPAKALIAAARETNAPGLIGQEPAIHDAWVVREVLEVRGLARLELGAIESGARSLLLAASAGSESARRALSSQAGKDEIRRVLGRLARGAALPEDARALAAVLSA